LRFEVVTAVVMKNSVFWNVAYHTTLYSKDRILNVTYFLHKALLFQAACEVWSKTLWVNLNPEVLLDGMENFMREFRCFNEAVKQLPVGQVLGTSMEDFKKSVSLFVELKNDALRDRHWQELMDKTGLCQFMHAHTCPLVTHIEMPEPIYIYLLVAKLPVPLKKKYCIAIRNLRTFISSSSSSS
jgi:hypothetical protein